MEIDPCKVAAENEMKQQNLSSNEGVNKKKSGVLIQKATSGGVSQPKTNCHLAAVPNERVGGCTGAAAGGFRQAAGGTRRRLLIRRTLSRLHAGCIHGKTLISSF
jgi:hypothetical protein